MSQIIQVAAAAAPQDAGRVMGRAEPTLLEAQRYVGMAYTEGVFDCADLTALVQWEMFGRTLALPPHADRPLGSAGQRGMIGALRNKLAQAVDGPQVGAVVLMSYLMPGATSAAQIAWHMGTLFEQYGQWWLLHNVHAMQGVYLQRLGDLDRQGLKIEGYYVCP